MKIGIAGAGGIGSNVARHLVQAGVEQIKIVDFDCVETSNLNRQFYSVSQVGRPKVECLKKNLEAILPYVHVDAVNQRLKPGDSANIFEDCAVVVEGFDDTTAKKYLVEELSGTGIPVVCASGIAGRDMTAVTSCCIGNCHIVGDFVTDVDHDLLFPPKVGMIAAMMAGIVLDQIEWTLAESQEENLTELCNEK